MIKNMRDPQKIIKQSKEKFNNQANGYDDKFNGKHAKSMYESIIKKLENLKSASILDVGFGTGNILKELANIYEKNEITLSGIDISKEMFAVAKEKLGNRADLRLGNSENLPWNDNTFDFVLCTDSFHHYPRPEIVLAEMKRVLKSKGTLIISDVRAPEIFRKIINFFIRYSSSGDVKIYSESEMKELYEISGFADVTTERAGKYGFITSGKCGS